MAVPLSHRFVPDPPPFARPRPSFPSPRRLPSGTLTSPSGTAPSPTMACPGPFRLVVQRGGVSRFVADQQQPAPLDLVIRHLGRVFNLRGAQPLCGVHNTTGLSIPRSMSTLSVIWSQSRKLPTKRIPESLGVFCDVGLDLVFFPSALFQPRFLLHSEDLT